MLKTWLSAMRLRTLPLSMSGIIVGSFVARWRLLEEGKSWHWEIFMWAILVTLLYQVLSNFANDYGDAMKGADAFRHQNAESRAVASGKITAHLMKKAVIITAILSFLATIGLLYTAFFPDFIKEFWIFIGLGVLCIFAAMGYTMGKKPYGYLGLGDIMVFIFFGQLSVVGSYFLFTKALSTDVFLLGSAVGLLATAVLNLNNMRDIESDNKSGKRTLALRLGYRKAMIYQMVLMNLPLIFVLIFLLLNDFHSRKEYYAFMVMILHFPMMALRRKILETKEPHHLDPFLKSVGIITFVMAILLAVGLNYFNE